MTVNSPAKRSKRARKFDKKNKVPVEKPRQPLPKAVFTRKGPAAEYSNFEHDDQLEKIEFERPEGHYIRFTGNKQRQSPFIFTFSYLSICLWIFFCYYSIEPEEEELLNRVEYDMDECGTLFMQK
jgi:hypothetical protein